MRKLILIMFSAIGLAQTNPTSFSKIKVINQTENNDAERIVVQNATTKEFHWIDKASFSPAVTLQTATNNGNTSTNDILRPISLGGGVNGVVGITGSGVKIGTNSERFSGNPYGLIKSDSLRLNRVYQLPDTSGVVLTNNSKDVFLDLKNNQTALGEKTFNNKVILKSGLKMPYNSTFYSNISYDFNNGIEFYVKENKIAMLSSGNIAIGNDVNDKMLFIQCGSVTGDRNVYFQDKSGTVALKEENGQMPNVPNSASLPANNTVPAGTIYFVSGTGTTYINNGTTWLGL